MTPQQYLEEICEPSVRELLAEPTSVRRAWAAVTALFHFADYFAKHRVRDLAVIRSELLSEFPDFARIQDIANASKHFELNRGSRKGLSARHAAVSRGAAFSDGSYYSDGSTHSDAPDVVRVDFQGEQIDVVNLCRRCLGYLSAKL